MQFPSRTSLSFFGAGGARNRLPAVLFFSILLLTAAAPAEEELDAFLPENTIFYASLEIESFTDKYRDLAIARFFEDSEVKALGKHIMEVFERKLAETESISYLVPAMNLAAKITDFGKRISFAVIDVRGPDLEGEVPPSPKKIKVRERKSNPKFVLYLEVSDRERFKDFIRQLYTLLGCPVPALDDIGPGDAKIVTMDFSESKGSDQGLVWVFTGDHFLLANHEATLERLMYAMQKGNRNGSLRNREDYRRLKNRLQKDGKGLFFALNTRLATAGALGIPEEAPKDEKPGQLSWIAASSTIKDQLMIDAINLIYTGRGGSFSLLDGFSRGIECNVPIPPNAFFYSCINLNPEILLERLEGLLAEEDPWAAKGFEKQLAMIAESTGLNIEELAGAFTGTATFYMRFPRFGYIPNMVGTIPVREGSDLETRLEKAAAYTGSRKTDYSLVKVRVGGELYGYYVKAREGVIYFQPAFCIWKDRLILANSLQELKGAVRWMQKAARGGGQNLLQKPEFTEMLKAAGGGVKENLIGAVYLDLGQLLATLYNSFAPLAGMFSREISFPIDTSLLPTSEVIEKYFDTVVMVVEDVEDGEGRFLSLRSASPVGVTPLFLLTLGSSVFVLLAPVPESEITAFEVKNGKGPKYDPVMPSPESPFMGLLFDSEDPPEPGMYITGIIEDTPAEEVGLLEGDILVKMGELEVSVLRDVSRALEGRKPGEELAIVFIRGKERLSAILVLARRGDFTDQ